MIKDNLEELSYLIGFLHADGHLYETTRNRGKVSIELNKKDGDILHKIADIIGCKSNQSPRTRNTNFKKNNTSICFSFYDLNTRNFLKAHGLIEGKKSTKVNISTGLIEQDYLRGYLDGNGSLGFDDKGYPFLSITTASEKLTRQIEKYIFNITGLSKNTGRNKRDNIFNICIYKEDAVAVAQSLYSNATIYLNRKYLKYVDIIQWKRPSNMRSKSRHKSWTDEEDSYILNHNLSECEQYLGRNKSSISIRLWRLTKGKV